jgi:uncharacterized membrane protein HdeD (DUF308 family)
MRQALSETVSDVVGPIEHAHKMWGWYLTLGVALAALGIYCIYAETLATVASVVVIGAVLILSGIFQLAAAVMARGAGHIVLLLLVGVLDIIVGLILVEHPEFGALIITLFLAALFVFAGVYRFVAALWLQFPHYGWVAFSGLVSLALGVLLWLQWPVSAFWFIGLAVGVNLIFAGLTWSSIALKLKNA